MSTVVDRLAAALADRYRIERELGAGGMATVYLAEDLKHDRKVAIKVLKPELAAVLGAERFVQEIKTTASLQHPHILPLFDSGEARVPPHSGERGTGGEAFLFYVMPYIEGETLRERLDRETQLGVEDAVRITTDVADALDYAHRNGVIHRDIKPENILLHDGRPMVMDFGIALAVSAAAGGRMTETGLSLGTPHYMSPEQATAAKDITARSDVYSLASVLYEMLTGDPPHTGSTAQQIIMKIVTEAADPVTSMRPSVPPNVAASVERALEKLPADRFTSARAFADALADPAFAGAGAAPAPSGRAAPVQEARVRQWGVMAALLVGGIAIGWFVRPVPDPPAPAVTRFTIPVPSGQQMHGSLSPTLAISSDGTSLGFVAGNAVYTRALDRNEARELAVVPNACCLTFSRDGRWILFDERTGRLSRAVSTDGGAVVDASTRARADDLVFGSTGMASPGIVRREAGDTAWRFVTTVDSLGQEGSHAWPQLLPGGRVLFTVLDPGMLWNGASVVVQDLETGTRTTVVEQATYGRYLRSGHIVYATAEGALEGVAFDLDDLRVTGDPVVLAEGVRVAYWGGAADYAVSENGTLAYIEGSTWEMHHLTEVDRSGNLLRRIGTPATFEVMSPSPDGRYAVAYVASNNADIARIDLQSGERRRLTFDETTEDNPVYAPDGRRVAYRKLVSGRDHRIYAQDIEGGGEPTLLFQSHDGGVPRTWSPDGRTLGVTNGSVFMLVDLEDNSVDTVTTQGTWEGGGFSPDGRWLAYVSSQTDRNEIYVVSFPELRGLRQVSTGGGALPRWARDSGELFFVNGDTIMVSSVTTGTSFTATPPRPLFALTGLHDYLEGFIVSADGQRFIYLAPNPDAAATEIHVVLNWAEEVRATMAER